MPSASWTEIHTVGVQESCLPPFSFYFDLIDVYWKAKGGNVTPLRRICTLARKQNVKHIVIESALSRPDIQDEIDALDALEGGGGAAEALSISFFSSPALPDDLNSAPNEEFLGQAILINYRRPGNASFDYTYVLEAVLPSPTIDGNQQKLLNNYVYVEGTFEREVRGRTFKVSGIFYCQQNSRTHVCAHACLRMALNTIGDPKNQLTSNAINRALGLTPPLDGLQLLQIQDVINNSGLANTLIIDCTPLNAPTYLSALASIIESGHLALLVFTTAGSSEHVVTVYGHTRNSDQWHPQAIPAYGGPSSAPYYSSSAWISNYLIHDDNFGPHYTLSSRALDSDPTVRAHWIIAVLPEVPSIQPHIAELIAAISLSNDLPTFASISSSRWFDFITRNNHKFVLRTLLIKKNRYLAHLESSEGHDGTRVGPAELGSLSSLAENLWMVEFSLPHLYTGNRSKLGEVIINANAPTTSTNPADYILAIRLPGVLLVKDENGKFVSHSLALESHIPVYRVGANGHEW